MDLFEYLFKWRREPDGTSVSQAEWRQLRAEQKRADATDNDAPEHEKPGLQLEEQRREARIDHVRARLFSAFGRARADFNRSSAMEKDRAE